MRHLVVSIIACSLVSFSACKQRQTESSVKGNVNLPRGFVDSVKPDFAQIKVSVSGTRKSSRTISEAPANQVNAERKKALDSLKVAIKSLRSTIEKVTQRLASPAVAQGVAIEASIRETEVSEQVDILQEIIDTSIPEINETINEIATQSAGNQSAISAYDTLLDSIEKTNQKVDDVLTTFEGWIGRFDDTGSSQPDTVPPGAFRDLITALDWKPIGQWPGDSALINQCKSILGQEWRLASISELASGQKNLSDPALNKSFTFKPNDWAHGLSKDGQTVTGIIPATRNVNSNPGTVNAYCVRQSNQFAEPFADTSIRSLWHLLGMWDVDDDLVKRCAKLGQGWTLPNRSEASNAAVRLSDRNINSKFTIANGIWTHLLDETGTKIGYGELRENGSFNQGNGGFLATLCIRKDVGNLPVTWDDSVANRKWASIGKWNGDPTIKDRCSAILGSDWKLPLVAELQNAAPRLTNTSLNTAFKVTNNDYVHVSLGANTGYMNIGNSSSSNGNGGSLQTLCVRNP